MLRVQDQQPGAPSVGAGGGSSAEPTVPKTRREKLRDAGFTSYPWLSKGEFALLDGEDYNRDEWIAHFALKGVEFGDDKRFARVVVPSEKFLSELANEGRIRWGSVNVRFYANSGASEKDGGSGNRLLCDPVCAGGETPGVFGTAHRRGPARSCLSKERANAREAARLAVLLATPSPHGVIVGSIARQTACVFNLREFRVGLLEEMRDLGEACVEKGKQIKSLHNERMAGLERIAVLFRAGRSHDDFDVVWEERSMIGLMDQLDTLAWDLECLGKRMEDAKAEFGTGI